MALHDLIDFSPIVDVGQPARGVKHEVFHQTAHDVILIVTNQNLLEFIIGAVLLSTGQFANGIDRPGVSLAPPSYLSVELVHLVRRMFHVAPTSAQIEILKGKADRVQFGMTNVTLGILPMLNHQLPGCLMLVVTCRRVELGNLQRRQLRRIVEDMLGRPGTAVDDPVVPHPSKHGLDSGMGCDPSTAFVIGPQPNLAKVSVPDATVAVMAGEDVVHHCPIT